MGEYKPSLFVSEEVNNKSCLKGPFTPALAAHAVRHPLSRVALALLIHLNRLLSFINIVRDDSGSV